MSFLVLQCGAVRRRGQDSRLEYSLWLEKWYSRMGGVEIVMCMEVDMVDDDSI